MQQEGRDAGRGETDGRMTRKARRGRQKLSNKRRGRWSVCNKGEFREKAVLRRKPGRSSAILVKAESFYHLFPHLRCCTGEDRSPSALKILQAGSCLFIKLLRKPEDLNHRRAPRCMWHSPGRVWGRVCHKENEKNVKQWSCRATKRKAVRSALAGGISAGLDDRRGRRRSKTREVENSQEQQMRTMEECVNTCTFRAEVNIWT